VKEKREKRKREKRKEKAAAPLGSELAGGEATFLFSLFSFSPES